jgi:hypothetical protein
MQSIKDAIAEWIKEILIGGITSNLSGMFDAVNTRVGEIAGEVGKTPSAWNGGVFSFIHSLSDNVIIPIAGIILTFVMVYELIQMIMEKNNMHDFETFMFFKWIFKTFIAVLIITNTFNIIMGIFDMAQHVVSNSAGVIISETSIDISTAIADMEIRLMEESIGVLFGIFLQSMMVKLTMVALNICIFVIIYGRMVEIYLMTSIGAIPFATMVNREWGGMGQNYLRAMLALGFQAFLIMVCVGIYAVLVQSIIISDDVMMAIWTCVGYTVLLCFTLFKTSSLAKSVFNAH